MSISYKLNYSLILGNKNMRRYIFLVIFLFPCCASPVMSYKDARLHEYKIQFNKIVIIPAVGKYIIHSMIPNQSSVLKYDSNFNRDINSFTLMKMIEYGYDAGID